MFNGSKFNGSKFNSLKFLSFYASLFQCLRRFKVSSFLFLWQEIRVIKPLRSNTSEQPET